jgi:predicted transcriptional regulator of viral defense system
MAASDFIAGLMARGRYHFTTEEALQSEGSSLDAVRAAIRRLRKKGLVATPYRGFHVIVPPEYRRIGCVPAEQFIPQLMERLGSPYYGALLTAARYHGAAHQQPQVFQVVVPKNRPGLVCGAVRVEFVARHNAERIPCVLFNTPRGRISVSSAEATAIDLIGYFASAGGLDNTATVLADLLDAMEPERLPQVAALSPRPWSQRLGYLLSLIGAPRHAAALSGFLAGSATKLVPLDPSFRVRGAPRDERWKVIVNVKVEPDL